MENFKIFNLENQKITCYIEYINQEKQNKFTLYADYSCQKYKHDKNILNLHSVTGTNITREI